MSACFLLLDVFLLNYTIIVISIQVLLRAKTCYILATLSEKTIIERTVQRKVAKTNDIICLRNGDRMAGERHRFSKQIWLRHPEQDLQMK